MKVEVWSGEVVIFKSADTFVYIVVDKLSSYCNIEGGIDS